LPNSRCWIVWDKNNTGNFADAELAWTSFKTGVRLYKFTWNWLVREGNRVIEGKKRVHPTQKPVGLFEKILNDFSEEGQTVADFYLGSGTTLIACERLGRKCRAIEISPAYVAVALQRWADMTGKTPVLLDKSGC
jgi:DNA modification methylase